MALTNTFSPNTRIRSADVNTNFTLVYEKQELNEATWNSGAAWSYTKRESQVTQRGFYWVTGDGTPSIDFTITFPVEYDDSSWDLVIQYFGV